MRIEEWEMVRDAVHDRNSISYSHEVTRSETQLESVAHVVLPFAQNAFELVVRAKRVLRDLLSTSSIAPAQLKARKILSVNLFIESCFALVPRHQVVQDNLKEARIAIGFILSA